MTTREMIQAEIQLLSEEDLEEFYNLVKQYVYAKKHQPKRRFMSKLKGIQIDAPEDFSTHFDLCKGAVHD